MLQRHDCGVINEQQPTWSRSELKIGFNRKEAAEMLSISVESLDRLVGRGLLKPSRALRRPLFSRAELERFIAETQMPL